MSMDRCRCGDLVDTDEFPEAYLLTMDSIGKPPHQQNHAGIKMRLTEICHNAGQRGVVMGHDYIETYYATMKKLCPNHPALTAYEIA